MEKKKENPLYSLLFNIVLPVLVLTKLSKPDMLGPLYALLVALAFPLGYGIYDFAQKKKLNFISVLGLVSVLLTGVFSLFELDPEWIAVKEAAVPLIIGLIIAGSAFIKEPLVKKLLLNEQFFKTDLVYEQLDAKNLRSAFESYLKRSSLWLALSFLLSAILNFGLAKYLVYAVPGTVEYNEQIGRLTALSFPVIALPCTVLMLFILWHIFKTIKSMTGLEMEELMNK